MVDQLLNVLQPLKAFLSELVDALPEATCDGYMSENTNNKIHNVKTLQKVQECTTYLSTWQLGG